jgi:hypothetical protein
MEKNVWWPPSVSSTINHVKTPGGRHVFSFFFKVEKLLNGHQTFFSSLKMEKNASGR